MKNKKAIEMSINFLVILIIAIVVFGFGIYLTFKFFGAAPGITDSVSKQLEQETLLMLSHGEKVALPVNQQTVQGGKHFVFGLGISNMIDADSTNFHITAELSKFIDSNDESQPFDESALNIVYSDSYNLKKGEQKVIPVAVSPAKNAPSGTYIIDIKVTYIKDGTAKEYSPLQKIYVTVP